MHCICIKVKGKGHTLEIAPLGEGISLQKCSAMARIVEGFHSFTCHPRVYPQMERTTPAFAAEAGLHLLTPEGWKAELA